MFRRIHAVAFAPAAEGVWVASQLPDVVPPSIADHLLQGNAHLDEADLLAEAETLLEHGQLPAATAAP